MATNLAGASGEPTEAMIDYYSERARGGTALLIVENSNIDYPLGRNGATQLRIDDDCFVPGLYRLVMAVQHEGAAICLQINHAGASTARSRTGGDRVVGPSHIPARAGGEKPVPLTITEIEALVEAYGRGAARARRAGFDAVEVHAAHSYLLAQFLSPLTNKREDRYGGSLEGRARFCLEVLEQVRREVGEEYPVLLRISADEFITGGRDLAGTLELLPLLEPHIDLLNITAATGYNVEKQVEPMSYGEGWRVYLSEEIKKFTSLPTITVGNLRNPQYINDLLSRGKADLVAMGRGLIADPHWVSKVAGDRPGALCRCISCNIGCADHRISRDIPVQCSINPDVVGNRFPGSVRTRVRRNIAVVGGGPAGMEAAASAAEEGHNVFLLEKEAQIGGLLRWAQKLPAKKKLSYYLEYMEERASRLPNLYLMLGKSATIPVIRSFKPDLVIDASGSVPARPPIAGLATVLEDGEIPVYDPLAFLAIIERFGQFGGKEVLIAGGGAVGLDFAEYFATAGAKVTVVEMMSEVGPDMERITRHDTLQVLSANGARLKTGACLEQFTKNRVFCRGGEEDIYSFDLALVALGFRPRLELRRELEANFDRVVAIGDSFAPRRIIDATREGRAALVNRF